MSSALPLHAAYRSPGLSFARAPAWLSSSLLAALVVVPTFDFRTEVETGFQFDIQLLVRLAVCAACCFYGLVYWRSGVDALSRLPGLWATVFCAWAVAVVPLSLSPVYSAAASGVLVCATVFVPAVLGELGTRRVLLTLLWSLLGYVALTWVLYFCVPSIGRSPYLLNGAIAYRVGADAQQLGLQSVWMVGVALALADRGVLSRRSLLILIALAVVTIAGSQSRTSFVALLLVFMTAAVLRGDRLWTRLAAFAGVALLACVGLAVGCGLIDIEGSRLLTSISRTGTTSEIFKITGRTEFWPYVCQKIAESPAWGHGYGCARQALFGFEGGGFTIGELRHAHNMPLNITLTTGLVGLLLYAGMHLAVLDTVLRRRLLFPAVALVVVGLCGLTESVVFGPMVRCSTVLWLVALFWQETESGPAELSSEQRGS